MLLTASPCAKAAVARIESGTSYHLNGLRWLEKAQRAINR